MQESYPALFQVLWKSIILCVCNFLQVLWHTVNPCFDIQNWTSSYRDQKSTIKRCKWKGIDVNCSLIFMTNPTDRGMCCTFNALAAEKIYRDSQFSRSVAHLQKQNVFDSFEYPSSMPPEFETGDEPSPETGTLWYKKYPLTFDGFEILYLQERIEASPWSLTLIPTSRLRTQSGTTLKDFLRWSTHKLSFLHCLKR